MANLESLPEEMCIEIFEKLDIQSIIMLSQTNRLFARLCDPADDSRRGILERFLIDAQAFPRWREDGYACFTCNKILFGHNFSTKQLKGTRGRNGSRQETRFCVACGVEKGKYSPGSLVFPGNVTHIVCRQCKQLRRGGVCCICRVCGSCRGRSVDLCNSTPGHFFV